ncbi:hypothetical protein LZP69_00530 [Shewanella sp. AS1]|uniref:hypothetical protein n=1 Tax=Shewanella sp. AS1 TaxID=2907626 RepID=UPI001F2084AA|nr:hypothetical protein [Shewanella sp. AS1]MCE9677675.1 hypothetical protein [Shewanella sp. AS1]
MIAASLLLAGALWAQVGESQALVCQRVQLAECLQHLPEETRAQLSQNLKQLTTQMGQRGAMVRPLRQNQSKIAGVVLLDSSNIPHSQSILLDGRVYSLTLRQAEEMTLRHELGHLAVTHSRSSYLTQTKLSGYQHEWLADLYLFWSLARDKQENELAWQQYHRRNLAVFESVAAISHWSTPMLAQVFEQYSWQQLGEFRDFDALIDAIYPKLRQYNQDELNEFASLIQQLFGANKRHHLPRYIFWRRPELGRYIQPTLEQLMGKSGAEAWLEQQALLVQG